MPARSTGRAKRELGQASVWNSRLRSFVALRRASQSFNRPNHYAVHCAVYHAVHVAVYYAVITTAEPFNAGFSTEELSTVEFSAVEQSDTGLSDEGTRAMSISRINDVCVQLRDPL